MLGIQHFFKKHIAKKKLSELDFILNYKYENVRQ